MKDLVLSIEDLSLDYGEKHLFDIERLAVYQNERIGIIGRNGEGKSSLLKLIMGDISYEKGRIQKEIEFAYYAQLPNESMEQATSLDATLLSHFNVPKHDTELMSGGEQSKYRLTETLSAYQEGMILDEPTTHLDKRSMDFLIEELRYYYGTLIFVSHDRYFLNQLATKIWEISDGQITEYHGNYASYRKQKEVEALEKERAYSNYQQEKKQLELSIQKKRSDAEKTSKVTPSQLKRNIKPDRLSSSKSKETVQKNLFKQAKNLEQRLEKLEPKHIQRENQPVAFPTHVFNEIHNPYPIMASDLCLHRGEKTLLNKCDFQFKKGKKIAIVGENGIGKTSLLKAILEREETITVSSKVRFSYYEQLSYRIKEEQSVLTFLMNQTDYAESVARSILNRLGFQQSELSKKVNQLSGGEQTRLSLALTMTKPSNVLILDEPTNFIDIATIEALESLIKSYEGMVIFTSHDAYFVKHIADEIYEMKDKQLILIS